MQDRLGAADVIRASEGSAYLRHVREGQELFGWILLGIVAVLVAALLVLLLKFAADNHRRADRRPLQIVAQMLWIALLPAAAVLGLL
jgi:uncharacterized membrane protein